MIKFANHKNIVQTKAAFFDDDTNEMTIVMEWCECGDLRMQMKEKARRN